MLPALEQLEAILGYEFADKELLRLALTHPSYAHEAGRGGHPSHDNQQLEFLGDAVLGLTASEWLVRRFPQRSEGYLSKLKARLVSEAHLAEVARKLGLGEYLFLGRGEHISGGRDKPAVLADALEALIGAVYLDGGLEAARRVVERWVVPEAEELASLETECEDYKGRLQELAQALKLPQPQYRLVGTAGPEHSKEFTVEVSIGDRWVATGRGSSKKRASQQAAAALLAQLQARSSGGCSDSARVDRGDSGSG